MKWLTIVFFFLPGLLLAQIPDKDSLLKVVKETQNDSMRITAYRDLYWVESMEGNYEKAEPYILKGIALAKKNKDQFNLGKCYAEIGLSKRKQGLYIESLEYSLKALEIFEKKKNLNGISITANNIGIIYKEQKNYTDALNYFKKSLSADERNKDNYGMALGYGNLAVVYTLTEDFNEAYAYNLKALRSFENMGDTLLISQAYGNLGGFFMNLSEIDSIESKFTSFPCTYKMLLDSSLYYRLKANQLQEGRSFFYDQSFTLSGIGFSYNALGDFRKGIPFCERALEFADRLHATDRVVDACNCLQMLWSKAGDYKKAYGYYQRYHLAKDSMINEDNVRGITQREMNFSFKKKKFEDSLVQEQQRKIEMVERQKSDAAKDEKLRRQRIYTFAGLGGLVLISLLAVVLFRGNKRKQRDNQIISEQKAQVEHQNEMLEEKNKEILDSINYAKRLQEAILPPLRIVKEYLPQSFILYKPKDIVAGDFYFMEPTGDKIVFAAADCTGHGVPGAMVSVVCSNALNRAVKEFQLTDAGEILDKVRDLVVSTFEKSESEVKDGMDISLCILDAEKSMLHWSGANNPLWLIRNGELLEFKPDKQPIGRYADPKPFHSHQIPLMKEDSIYIFTDGYEDQFGGEKGKKFKSSRMKELMLSVQHLPMDAQRERINESFENWRGQLEQIDDVCIIGVKI